MAHRVARGAFVIIGLVVTACAKPAPELVREITVSVPQTVVVPHTVIVPQTVVVQRTVVVLQTVKVPVTLVVSATPSPTPSETPTPESTATPAVAIPANWKTYEHPTGAFVFKYPPHWVLKDQGPNTVTFQIGGSSLATVSVSASPIPADLHDSETMNSLVLQALNNRTSSQSAQVIDKGDWPFYVPGIFVELSVYDSIYGFTDHIVDALLVPDPAHPIAMILARVAGTFSEAEEKNASMLAASVRAK
jgi:hypothetical protein